MDTSPTPSVFPIPSEVDPRIIIAKLDDAMMCLIMLRVAETLPEAARTTFLMEVGISLMLIRQTLASSIGIGSDPTHDLINTDWGQNAMERWMIHRAENFPA